MRKIGAFVLSSFPCISPAGAQHSASNDDEIMVTGGSRDYRLTSKGFAAALKAFRKYRPSFAPAGALWFEVAARGGDPSLEGI